jgi:alkylated DNA repair dioxygenase AlkB
MVAHQRSLFAGGAPAVDPTVDWTREHLGPRSWVDIARRWFGGTDALLDRLVADVEWHQGRRRMYDRMVDDPRLSHRYDDPRAVPHPSLSSVRAVLNEHYHVDLGPLALNYYRDGQDSVAYHRDRELRDLDDTIIAIVTLGEPRPFLLRPLAGSPRRARDLAPGPGDLLVMGGACQMEWEHGVPKVARAGPRISATWRWARR